MGVNPLLNLWVRQEEYLPKRLRPSGEEEVTKSERVCQADILYLIFLPN